jgi:hypothetical protein
MDVLQVRWVIKQLLPGEDQVLEAQFKIMTIKERNGIDQLIDTETILKHALNESVRRLLVAARIQIPSVAAKLDASGILPICSRMVYDISGHGPREIKVRIQRRSTFVLIVHRDGN